MKKIRTYILFICILFSNWLMSQEIKFFAQSSHTEVVTGDRFQVQFISDANITNFKAPDFADFRVLSGPNQSTSMSWVNGKTTTSISYSFILMAVKEGTFTIKPAFAAFEGAAYKTNALSITVGKGVNVQQQQQQQNSSEEPTNISKADATKDLFIKSSVSKSKIYQGEHLIATYKLYTKVNIVANELVKNADLNGFWSQEIDLGQAQWSQEVFGGIRWNVATIRKIVLFPQRSGSLTIDPLEMKFVVQRRVSGGNSVFDQFFGRVENAEYNLKSEPLKVTVLPFPENKPASFNGAVGQFEFTSNLSTNKVKANEAVNLKLKIAGKGNLPLVDKLTVEFPKDFETYDPKVSDNFKTSTNGVSGSKEFDYLIIPRHQGSYTIEPIEFAYFDPNTNSFKTLKTKAFTIDVEKGDDSGTNITYSGANKEDIQFLGKDIRYIQVGDILYNKVKTNFYGSWMFYVLVALMPILFAFTLIFRDKYRTIQSDVVGLKSKKANKMAAKHLASAEKSLNSNLYQQFYEDISKSLFGYTSDKLKIPVSELSKENIAQRLYSASVTASTVANLLDTIEMCEMARYAPITVQPAEIYAKTENIINQLEKEIRL